MEPLKGIAASPDLDAAGLHVCVVRTQWNAAVVDALTAGAAQELQRLGAAVTVVEVRVCLVQGGAGGAGGRARPRPRLRALSPPLTRPPPAAAPAAGARRV